MIDRKKLQDFIESRLEGTDAFLTDLSVSPDNNITVEIDSDTRVDLDFCILLTKAIEGEFPRDDEDYELEVGSAGLTSPLKTPRQYAKNIGNDLEVLTTGGRKLRGELTDAGDTSFTLQYTVREKQEGAKRPVDVTHTETIPYSEVKTARYDLKF